MSPLATATAETTGPGKFYETLMELKAGDDLAHFGYVTNSTCIVHMPSFNPWKA